MSTHLNKIILKNLYKEMRNRQLYIRKINIKDINIENGLGINLNEKNKLIDENKLKNKINAIKINFNKDNCFAEKIKYSKINSENYEIVNESKKENCGKKFNKEYKIHSTENKIVFKYIIILINFIIMSNLVSLTLANIERIKLYESKITLKINQTGYSFIYSSTFNTAPSQIIINDIPQSTPLQNQYLFNESENTIILIWDSNLINCNEMFKNCSNITEFDFTNFDTSEVTIMRDMFLSCYSLTEINVSNFNTSSLNHMDGMFYDCISLTSLNLSNFDTSKVTMMAYLFRGCSSLTYLDISNFDTSQVENMIDIFWGCSEIVSLDIFNFNTSKVTFMDGMFNGCSKLSSLNLSHFDTSKVISIRYMFHECSSLTSLDLSNFITSSITDMENTFCGCLKLSCLDISNFNTSLVKYGRYVF